MDLEKLIWVSIVLHIATSLFLLFVTWYTYRKMTETSKYVQKTISEGVENGTKRLETAINDPHTYDLLVKAVEDRLMVRLNEMVEYQNKNWANRMSQMRRLMPDIAMVGAGTDDGSHGLDPIAAGIEALTHKRGPVGWLNENAGKVAQSAREMYNKWKNAPKSKKTPPAPNEFNDKEFRTVKPRKKDVPTVGNSEKPNV